MTEHDARPPDRLTVAAVVALARTIYADAHGGIKHKQMLRPYICPFHLLVDRVDRKSVV